MLPVLYDQPELFADVGLSLLLRLLRSDGDLACRLALEDVLERENGRVLHSAGEAEQNIDSHVNLITFLLGVLEHSLSLSLSPSSVRSLHSVFVSFGLVVLED